MKPLSRISATFTESVIREMTRVCHQKGGVNLAQGFPDFDTVPEIKEAAVQAIRDGHNQYAVTFGQPRLREALAAKVLSYNGIRCDPATEITVTCGATEAMIAALKAMVNPGEEIVIFEPFYENYGPDSILSGATPRYVSLRPPAMSYDPEELRGAFNEKTKAVIVNTPNNPTGRVFTRRELGEIAELCLQWDCYAVTDEIYEHIVYDGRAHVSLATLPGMAERTVTIGSLSKTYSATGWRVGWAIASQTLTGRIRKVHDFLTVGAPAPLQEAAVVALTLPDSYYRSLRERYQRARDMLYEALEEAGFQVSLPEGSYYMLAGAGEPMKKFGSPDDRAFSLDLIDRAGVATVPGSAFFTDESGGGRDQVRFCFCKRESTLEEVRRRLRALWR